MGRQCVGERCRDRVLLVEKIREALTDQGPCTGFEQVLCRRVGDPDLEACTEDNDRSGKQVQSGEAREQRRSCG